MVLRAQQRGAPRARAALMKPSRTSLSLMGLHVFHVHTAAGCVRRVPMHLRALCQDCCVVLGAAMVLGAKRTGANSFFKIKSL